MRDLEQAEKVEADAVIEHLARLELFLHLDAEAWNSR